ncbi:hypothetical protein HHI36_013650, partial [Cryptolaemus montrouzieri]
TEPETLTLRNLRNIDVAQLHNEKVDMNLNKIIYIENIVAKLEYSSSSILSVFDRVAPSTKNKPSAPWLTSN